ncbi:hypothetical protein D9M69_244130 [compost metagenome]
MLQLDWSSPHPDFQAGRSVGRSEGGDHGLRSIDGGSPTASAAGQQGTQLLAARRKEWNGRATTRAATLCRHPHNAVSPASRPPRKPASDDRSRLACEAWATTRRCSRDRFRLSHRRQVLGTIAHAAGFRNAATGPAGLTARWCTPIKQEHEDDHHSVDDLASGLRHLRDGEDRLQQRD